MMLMRKKSIVTASAVGPLVAVLVVMSMGQAPGPNFGDPLPGVTATEQANFLAGQAQFQNVEAVADGLGPVFNEDSCVLCHTTIVNGLSVVGAGSARLETRFGLTVNGVFDPLDGTSASGLNLGGSLMQDHAIGLVGGITYVPEVVPPQANVVALRRTTPLFGLGLVDNVPDSTFQQIALAEQANSPTTAGRVSIVFDTASQTPGRVGKFGWKCQEPTLFSFSGDAYLNEMGITTTMFPVENCPQGNCSLLNNPALPPVPNDDNGDLVKFTNFMTFLGPPPQLPLTNQARQGQAIFSKIGCADCHLPSLTTGPNSSAALNQVTFFPYSDFLLHDMGTLGDGIAQSDAGQTEMRTAPLWGVRLQTVLLHDGSATSIRQAIRKHRGQGEPARNAFVNLNDNQQAALVAFLNSL
jgi:CxxC motif-containing protein (DUF1111 family)